VSDHSGSVVIGHDHRHNSDAFARLAGAVFLKKGIKVYYYKKLVHTPMVRSRNLDLLDSFCC
jgi:phosphomannomutase